MDYLKSFGITSGQGKYHQENVYLLALTYNVLNAEISTYLKDFRLTPAKLNVLMTIRHQGGKEGISQVDISKWLIVTPSNMTRLLDRLEKEGFIQRLAQKGDRRVNIIQITTRGAQVLDRVWPGYLKILEKLSAGLKWNEQRDLSLLMSRWLGILVNHQ